MILTLDPDHERMVNEELRTGPYRSAGEVIGCALEALREKERGFLRRAEKRDPKRAAARIRERRKGVTLGGLKIKDLVNEGRR
jgi:Arc/MetJ-type ribon-helix-helix transcriptional regulator